MIRENKFHLSVMTWLGKNDWMYWHEQTLKGSYIRPDFLAVSPTGQRAVIECKANTNITQANLNRIDDYLEQLNQPGIKPYLAIPDDLILQAKVAQRIEYMCIEILRIPVVEIDIRALWLAYPENDLGDFFQLFAPPAYFDKPYVSFSQLGRQS